MDKNYPNRIKELRNERSMTIEDLAERTGLSVSYVSRLENGERNLSVKNLNLFAHAFDVAAQDILAKAPEKAPNVIGVMGRIGAGAEILPEEEQIPPEGLYEIETPFPPAPRRYCFRGDWRVDVASLRRWRHHYLLAPRRSGGGGHGLGSGRQDCHWTALLKARAAGFRTRDLRPRKSQCTADTRCAPGVGCRHPISDSKRPVEKAHACSSTAYGAENDRFGLAVTSLSPLPRRVKHASPYTNTVLLCCRFLCRIGSAGILRPVKCMAVAHHPSGNFCTVRASTRAYQATIAVMP